MSETAGAISPRAVAARDAERMDFGFKRYDLGVVTRRIELPEVSPDAARPLTLIVRCAQVGNRDFANSLFKLAKANTAAAAAEPAGESTALVVPAPAAPKDEAAIRREVAALYAGTALVGWENATSGGEPVPFAVEAAQELLVQLMEHVPDIWRARVRDYVDDVANFRSAIPTVDPVDLGKG